MTALLACCGISKRFGSVEAIRHFTIIVDHPALIGIVGPNGSGKTVLLDILSGFEHADSGAIRYHGRDVSMLSAWQIARMGIRRTFAGAPNLARLRVAEYLSACTVGCYKQPINSGIHSRVDVSSFVLLATAIERLDNLIGHWVLDAPIETLSFGQRKLIMICGALAQPGDFILLDEPLAGIDPENTKFLANAIASEREKGRVILWAEHNVALLRSVCDRIWLLSDGNFLGEFESDSEGLAKVLFEVFRCDGC